MEDTLKRRFFYDQAFAIYGGRGLMKEKNVLLVALIWFLNEKHSLPIDISLYQVMQSRG